MLSSRTRRRRVDCRSRRDLTSKVRQEVAATTNKSQKRKQVSFVISVTDLQS